MPFLKIQKFYFDQFCIGVWSKNQMHLAVRILFSGITQSSLLIGTRKLNPSIRSVGPSRCLAAVVSFVSAIERILICVTITEENFSKCFINL